MRGRSINFDSTKKQKRPIKLTQTTCILNSRTIGQKNYCFTINHTILIKETHSDVAWAWAFSKTKSIMLPFGLHLGWNFVHNTIFSKGPLGELVMISQGGEVLTDWSSLFNFVSGLILVPILVIVFVKYFVKEYEAQ